MEKREVAAVEIRFERIAAYSARQLAAEMLAEAGKTTPEDIRFYTGENGKPLCRLPLHFNCSHSGAYVVCAVSEREVGVDLERVRPVHERLLRTLTAEEKIWLSTRPEGDRDRAFFQLWTMKESWIKCHGGTLMEYRRCNFCDENGRLMTHWEGCRFIFPSAPEGYVLTICEKE